MERSGGNPAVAAEVVRLSNWTALLTFATAFAVIAALVALPTAFSREPTLLARFAAMVPTVAAAIGLISVWRTRKMLRAARALTGGKGT